MDHHLDDPSFVKRHDPKGMYDFTLGFPNQCREALGISHSVRLPDALGSNAQVVVAGMGGSAAGGDFLKALFDAAARVPCAVCRDYALPHSAGPSTLVLACSYSGNTEETVAATEDAYRRGCDVIAVTTGGKLADLAASQGSAVIKIPAGQPPRTALGYLFVPLVEVAVRLGYLPSQQFDSAFMLLDECAKEFGMDRGFSENLPKSIADRLFGAVPLIYGLGTWQGAVANRWKGQINENAKVMAFANSLPELNHNEIIGWQLADKQNVLHWVTIFLEGGIESPKMRKRKEVTAQIISPKSESYTVLARGESLVGQLLSLSYFGDFLSLYLAALNEVDPETIDAINQLKGALAQVD